MTLMCVAVDVSAYSEPDLRHFPSSVLQTEIYFSQFKD